MTTAFIFPGQGSQAVGMGRDVYESSAAARAVFEDADATLGFALSALCFEGPDAHLTATENAQPALLTVSVALLAALGEKSEVASQKSEGATSPSSFILHPLSFVAGHSLGEYSALVAAGALDFAVALRLVRRRGELMAAAREGAMAAIIGMDEAPLEELCRAASDAHGPVVIANYNSPGQLVISGTAAGVEHAIAEAKARGAKRALPLKVSAAFHSPLMQAAADGMAVAVCEAHVRDARIPVVANVHARPITRVDNIRSELVAQITAPVRWIASVQHMTAAGVDTFVEIGPGSVLTGLIKRIAPEAKLVNVNSSSSVEAYLQGIQHSESRIQ